MDLAYGLDHASLGGFSFFLPVNGVRWTTAAEECRPFTFKCQGPFQDRDRNLYLALRYRPQVFHVKSCLQS
jgi:hypothetical protein